MNSNYDATVPTGLPLNCFTCDRVIPDWIWFARLKLGDGRIAFCRPRCLEKYLENPAMYAAKASSGSPVFAHAN